MPYKELRGTYSSAELDVGENKPRRSDLAFHAADNVISGMGQPEIAHRYQGQHGFPARVKTSESKGPWYSRALARQIGNDDSNPRPKWFQDDDGSKNPYVFGCLPRSRYVLGQHVSLDEGDGEEPDQRRSSRRSHNATDRKISRGIRNTTQRISSSSHRHSDKRQLASGTERARQRSHPTKGRISEQAPLEDRDNYGSLRALSERDRASLLSIAQGVRTSAVSVEDRGTMLLRLAAEQKSTVHDEFHPYSRLHQGGDHSISQPFATMDKEDFRQGSLAWVTPYPAMSEVTPNRVLDRSCADCRVWDESHAGCGMAQSIPVSKDYINHWENRQTSITRPQGHTIAYPVYPRVS